MYSFHNNFVTERVRENKRMREREREREKKESKRDTQTGNFIKIHSSHTCSSVPNPFFYLTYHVYKSLLAALHHNFFLQYSYR